MVEGVFACILFLFDKVLGVGTLFLFRGVRIVVSAGLDFRSRWLFLFVS